MIYKKGGEIRVSRLIDNSSEDVTMKVGCFTMLMRGKRLNRFYVIS